MKRGRESRPTSWENKTEDNMNRLNGYKLLASGAEFAPSIVNEVIVNLTGLGVVNDPENGHFVGIDKDSRGYYQVVVGGMKRYRTLSAAKKHLTRLVPDWELRIEESDSRLFDLDVAINTEDEEDFSWLDRS